MSTIHILSIETSCDETAISIAKIKEEKIEILSNLISSQVKLHAQWGGVVPNLAAREHMRNITPILEKSFTLAKISPREIDLIAVTQGPGLIPALLVGVDCAKTLSYLWEKPLIGIHHIEGHIYANFINRNQASGLRNQEPKACSLKPKALIKFPALVLVVSGGHTQLVLMKNHLNYKIIGQTLDDAVGEAFDKVARILNIGYPGGPAVAQWAKKYKKGKCHPEFISGSRKVIEKNKLAEQEILKQVQNDKIYKINFPRPMINKPGYNFSFSGLKTAVLYETKKNPHLLKDDSYVSAICREFQQACIDVLISKTIKAAKEYKPKTIMLAGGVSANKELRKQLGEAIKNLNYLSNQSYPSYSVPDLSLTGDNAAMIASAATFRWQKMSEAQKNKSLENWKIIEADANLKLK